MQHLQNTGVVRIAASGRKHLLDPVAEEQDTDTVVEFEFTDRGNQAVALHLRRGVVEYVPVPANYYRASDSILQMDSATWAALYLSQTDLERALAAEKVHVKKGDPQELATLWALFDRFEPGRNFKIPPLED